MCKFTVTGYIIREKNNIKTEENEAFTPIILNLYVQIKKKPSKSTGLIVFIILFREWNKKKIILLIQINKLFN